MTYINIINNSEKYIEMLKQKDKIYVREIDIKPCEELIKKNDTLWGYYDVKYFKINEKEIIPSDIFSNYKVICGDFFCGEGFLQKIFITKNNNEWIF